MKNANIIIAGVAIAGLAAFSSCKKEQPGTKKSVSQSMTALMKNDNADLQISLIADRSTSVNGTVATNFHFEGFAPAGFSAGNLTIGGKAVPFTNGTYSWFATQQDAPSDYFGKTTIVEGAGSSDFGQFSISQYMPLPLDLTFSGISANREVSLSTGVKVNWTVDNNNTANTMVIGIQSESAADNEPQGKSVYHLVTENSGTYSFTAQDLAAFQPGDRLRVYVGRGNDQLYSVGTKSLEIFALLTCAGYRLTAIQ